MHKFVDDELIVTCDYCGEPAVLRDSKEIYGRDYHQKIWHCAPCEAWVGTHRNSKRHIPLGRLADEELRYWKQLAHGAFDPLWKKREGKNKKENGIKRSNAYRWLAEKLGIDVKDCHIGMFDVDQCREVVKICNQISREEAHSQLAAYTPSEPGRLISECPYNKPPYKTVWIKQLNKSKQMDLIDDEK